MRDNQAMSVKMNDITIGAVGAAIVAGLVSLLGLIIGKEQKVSEFRQAWIDDLRTCVVSYLVNINAICDILTLKKSGSVEVKDTQGLLQNYKLLNEASHGIYLRINDDEEPAKKLTASMKSFEDLAADNSTITPAKIKEVEKIFVDASKELLKYEWDRVKKGEPIFVWTKRIITVILAAFIIFFAVSTYSDWGKTAQPIVETSDLHLVQK